MPFLFICIASLDNVLMRDYSRAMITIIASYLDGRQVTFEAKPVLMEYGCLVAFLPDSDIYAELDVVNPAKGWQIFPN